MSALSVITIASSRFRIVITGHPNTYSGNILNTGDIHGDGTLILFTKSWENNSRISSNQGYCEAFSKDF